MIAAAALTLAGLIEAGPAGSAKPTVTISGRAYVFNHSETSIAGATIRVRELGATAITDANGDYELTVPDETLVTPYIEPPAGYHEIDLQTFHTRGKAIQGVVHGPPQLSSVFAAARHSSAYPAASRSSNITPMPPGIVRSK